MDYIDIILALLIVGAIVLAYFVLVKKELKTDEELKPDIIGASFDVNKKPWICGKIGFGFPNPTLVKRIEIDGTFKEATIATTNDDITRQSYNISGKINNINTSAKYFALDFVDGNINSIKFY